MNRLASHLFTVCSALSVGLGGVVNWGCAAPSPPRTAEILDDNLRTAAPVTQPASATQPATLPSGTVQVFTVTRAVLQQRAKTGWPGGHATTLLYMGSKEGYDYYYVAHHTFSQFYRVPREENSQPDRMPLTGNSRQWREVSPQFP